MSRQKYYSAIMRPTRVRGGFLSNLYLLSCVIGACVHTRRVLILLPAFSVNSHNASIPSRKQIYDYLDLDETRLLIDGKQKPFSYTWLKDLDKKDMANWTVHLSFSGLGPEKIEYPDDDTADLLIFLSHRRIKRWPFHPDVLKLNGILTPPGSPDKKNKKPKHKKQVIFSPRQEYRRLSEQVVAALGGTKNYYACLLYTSPSPRDRQKSRMPSSA